MDVLAWIWWMVASLLGVLWTVVWFLLGGWVSTLAQICVLVLIVFGLKYGWRRAPHEAIARVGAFSRFAWAWLRSGEAPPMRASAGHAGEQQRAERRRALQRRRQPGDIRVNVSTVLSLMMIAGLGLMTAL